MRKKEQFEETKEQQGNTLKFRNLYIFYL